MSKANAKKRPAQTEHAALGAKKKIKTADVSSDCSYGASHVEPNVICICMSQEVLMKVKALAKRVREDPVLSR